MRERPAEFRQVLQQRQRVGVGVVGLGVAAGHEHPGDPLAGQPVADLAELGAAVHHPRGEVGYDDVPVAGQALGEVQRGAEALARRRRDGDDPFSRQMRQHGLFGGRRGQHLVARVGDQAGQQLGMTSVAHDETRFVMRINRSEA